MSCWLARAALLGALGATMAACGSSSESGTGGVCSTFNVSSNIYDTNGMDLCEMYVTTSGSSRCGTVAGIAAEIPGACPTHGLLGCCVSNLGNAGFAAGTLVAGCWYDTQGANAGRVGCNGPNDAWQPEPP
jgi:hypothetical protein